MRGYTKGTYLVNAHVYNKKPWKDGKNHRSNIKIELIKLNPYSEVAQAEFVAVSRGQEFTAFKFTLDKDGKVIKLSSERETIIGAKSVYGIGNQTNELGTSNSGTTLEEAERWIQGESW